MSHSDARKADADDAGTPPGPRTVAHCPFCGELIGSFWGRTGDDDSRWCESCQVFFRVSVDA